MSFVFLHGFAGTPRVFAPWLARFGGMAPEILGHGTNATRATSTESSASSSAAWSATSPATSTESSASSATFDEEVDRLAALASSRATWFGYSMGGRLALGVSARHPHLVARLILVAAHPGLEDDAARARRRAEDESRARTLETEGLDSFLRAWDALPMFARRTPPPREGLDARELARAMRVLSTGAMPPRWETLAHHDVTYVVGEHDAAYRPLAEQVKRRAPRARIELVPSADHDVLGCGDRAWQHVETLLQEAS